MLSVIIICQNEQTNIRACLESVSFADEIVIVDSGSTDDTLSICSEYTSLIFHQEWLGMNRQKDFALTKATGDWILNIDADERVSKGLAEEINEIESERDNQISGYYIPRKTYYLGKWLRFGGWSHDYKLRLFRRESGKWTGTDPHDEVGVSGKTAYLKHPLLHISFQNLADHIQCNNKYSTVAAQEMDKRNRTVNWLVVISHTLGAFGKSYFLKGGLLEGTRGLIQAIMIAQLAFAKYAKLWELRYGSAEDSDIDVDRGKTKL